MTWVVYRNTTEKSHMSLISSWLYILYIYTYYIYIYILYIYIYILYIYIHTIYIYIYILYIYILYIYIYIYYIYIYYIYIYVHMSILSPLLLVETQISSIIPSPAAVLLARQRRSPRGARHAQDPGSHGGSRAWKAQNP